MAGQVHSLCLGHFSGAPSSCYHDLRRTFMWNLPASSLDVLPNKYVWGGRRSSPPHALMLSALMDPPATPRAMYAPVHKGKTKRPSANCKVDVLPLGVRGGTTGRRRFQHNKGCF